MIARRVLVGFAAVLVSACAAFVAAFRIELNREVFDVCQHSIVRRPWLFDLCVRVLDVNQWGTGYNPLLLTAVEQGRGDAVTLLLRHGANPNIRAKLGATPLDAAAGRGLYSIAAELIDAGAMVNRKGEDWTPIRRAINSCDRKMVELLLNAGADAGAAFGNGPIEVCDEFKPMLGQSGAAE